MTQRVQNFTDRLKRITAINVFLSLGFGIVTRSIWDLQANSGTEAILYFFTRIVGGVMIIIVCGVTLYIAFNLRASDFVGIKMATFVLISGVVGLCLSILPSFTSILVTFTLLILVAVFVASEGHGITSK